MSAPEPSNPTMISNTDGSEEIAQLILDLADNNLRDQALIKLCSRDDILLDLGPHLWFSFRTVAIFLEEIVSVYRLLSSPSQAPDQFARIRRILVLLQCVAFHPDTKLPMLQAQITAYLHPFLNTRSDSKVLEDLRCLSLGVIGSLLIKPDMNVMLAVLSTRIMPLILTSMEIGAVPSKTTATFILCRILFVYPEYICSAPERLIAVNNILAKVVISLYGNPSARLYQLVIKCYLRLSQDESGVVLLRQFCPSRLVTDDIFRPFREQDENTRLSLQCLIDNIQGEGNLV